MLVTSAFRGSAVSHHIRAVWALVAAQVRVLDRRLRPPGARRGVRVWSIPIAGFTVCAAVLVLAGAMSGVWAAEYIPTAMFESLVIAGLLLVCIAPVMDSPDSDHGDRGPDPDPFPSPPPFDPTLWVRVMSEPERPPNLDREPNGAPARELVEAHH